MDADERVLRWAAQRVRNASGLHTGTLGTDQGTRNWHYRSCPDLKVEVVAMREEWYSTLTYDGWKIDTLVSCPHGQVVTSNGITPLIPVEVTLNVGADDDDIERIIEELDAQDEHTPS